MPLTKEHVRSRKEKHKKVKISKALQCREGNRHHNLRRAVVADIDLTLELPGATLKDFGAVVVGGTAANLAGGGPHELRVVADHSMVHRPAGGSNKGEGLSH